MVCVLAFAVNASAWTSVDVGTPTAGSAGYDAPTGAWTVTGNGNDIWGNSDNFHYVYKYLVGDGEIIARVAEIGPGTNDWTKAGVMMRDKLTGPSVNIMEAITAGSGGGETFQWRPDESGGCSSSHTHSGISPPYWIRLVREGDQFTGYFSADGVNWTQEGSAQTLEMRLPPTDEEAGCYIGLAITSHEAGELRTAVFDNITLIGDISDEAPPQLKAWQPNPSDGAEGVIIQLLEWTPGETAAFHDVYFGTTPDLGPDDLQTRNNKAVTMYWHVPGLVPGTTYYWRIDEVEADGTTVHTGDVWSFSTPPSTAWDPSPPDGSQFQDPNVDLSWLAGMNATKHDVYFGTDEAAVANGTGDTFKGSVADTTFDPNTLARETTYYWRIDEIDSGGTTHEGDLWSFTTIPVIPVTDPNLIGWWKLDEGAGGTAIDSSGHDHHGILVGDPQWVAGYDGGALEFDNVPEDRVSLGAFDVQGSGITITCWFKADNLDTIGSDPRMVSKATGGAGDAHWFMVSSGRQGGQFRLRFRLKTTDGQATTTLMADTEGTIELDEWIHVTATWDGTTMRIYKNSIEVGSADKAGDALAAGPTVKVAIGNQPQGAEDRPFDGIIDDVRIYNKGVTAADIPDIMRGDTSLAWDPSPADGSVTDVERATPLTWKPGDNAAQHDIYFGTDRDAVEDANASDTTGVYRNRQAFASYTPPEALQWGQTHYWRIDEYNTDMSISTGRLWSFTVADYLIVEDFEDYNDFTPDRVWQTWHDGYGYSEPPPGFAGNGTGSQVGNDETPFTEQTIVHSGLQAMTFGYTNNGSTGKAMYSETEREWAVPQNWTVNGVKGLSLWFNGDAANSAEPLYVGVQDSLGTRKDVPHENTSAVLIGGWEEWNIDLQEFANAGVNLTSVKKMYIGVGNRLAPQMGGTGTLYFDDMRLYRPRCLPDKAKPVAGFNNDCVVDHLDLEILADDWLVQDVLEPVWNGTFTSQDVGTPSVAGSYTFDGSTYTIHADGNDIWGNADNFHYAYRQISGDTQMTVRVVSVDPVHGWAKAGIMIRDTLDTGSPNAMVAITGGSGDGGTFQWRTDADGSSGSSRTLTGISPPSCVKLVREGDTFTGYVFLDGKWQQEGTSTTVAMIDPVYIGLAVTSHTDGTLTTAAFDRACTFSAAELHQDGVIDFKDYAAFADAWLDEVLWP
jgi:hypothetical protein